MGIWVLYTEGTGYYFKFQCQQISMDTPCGGSSNDRRFCQNSGASLVGKIPTTSAKVGYLFEHQAPGTRILKVSSLQLGVCGVTVQRTEGLHTVGKRTLRLPCGLLSQYSTDRSQSLSFLLTDTVRNIAPRQGGGLGLALSA